MKKFGVDINRLISFWKAEEIKVCLYLCKGWNTHPFCICDRNNITHYNIRVFVDIRLEDIQILLLLSKQVVVEISEII